MIAENGLDPADLPDGEVGFSQDIGFITLHGSAKVYDGFFQWLSTISRNGDTSFSYNDDTLTLTANIDMCTGEGCTLQLSTFDIKEIGNIDVHIHGLGPLDWILGTVTGFVADLIRDFLADVLEGPIKDLLQGILNDLLPSL